MPLIPYEKLIASEESFLLSHMADPKNAIKSLIASEESFLLSMGDPKNAIKSLILVVEQFCIEHFLILFQF